LEQVPTGYPEANRDEAPTWIASPALRAEVLGEWPVAAPSHDEPEAADDPWNVRELPAAPLGELDPRTDEVAVLELEEAAPEPAPQPTPSLDLELARSAQGIARYSLDPLGDLPPKRRFGRGSA